MSRTLIRDKHTGNWYTKDGKYCVYRVCFVKGWWISEVDNDGLPDVCSPLFRVATLSDARNMLSAECYNKNL